MVQLVILMQLILLKDHLKLKQKQQVKLAMMAQKIVQKMKPLKYLRNFCSTLEMPLITCEINLNLIDLKKVL